MEKQFTKIDSNEGGCLIQARQVLYIMRTILLRTVLIVIISSIVIKLCDLLTHVRLIPTQNEAQKSRA